MENKEIKKTKYSFKERLKKGLKAGRTITLIVFAIQLIALILNFDPASVASSIGIMLLNCMGVYSLFLIIALIPAYDNHKWSAEKSTSSSYLWGSGSSSSFWNYQDYRRRNH